MYEAKLCQPMELWLQAHTVLVNNYSEHRKMYETEPAPSIQQKPNTHFCDQLTKRNDLFRVIKALLHLHCAIFSATCITMVEIVALQVAEVWC